MAYGQDLPGSARRHFAAAETLHDDVAAGKKLGNTAIAGYLFGLSAELALKQLMIRSGMIPPSTERKGQENPFYAHFPLLKTLIRDQARGRQSQTLQTLAADDKLFQHWDIKMRYAAASEIKEQWVTQWRNSAKELIAHMEIS